jgi:hypothetical protein
MCLCVYLSTGQMENLGVNEANKNRKKRKPTAPPRSCSFRVSEQAPGLEPGKRNREMPVRHLRLHPRRCNVSITIRRQ